MWLRVEHSDLSHSFSQAATTSNLWKICHDEKKNEVQCEADWSEGKAQTDTWTLSSFFH